jgi:hypothetical protein
MKCEWYRKFKEKSSRLATSGNTYQVSAMDVGAEIIAEIQSNEDDTPGKATVIIGPIMLDPGVQSTLSGILQSGGSKFLVESISGYDADESVSTG